MSSRPNRSHLAASESAVSIQPAAPPRPVFRRTSASEAGLLTDIEYEQWLLPTAPYDRFEKAVHWLSLGAGVIAFTLGACALWVLI